MLLFALGLLGGMVAAAVLHELTHVAAVVAVGGRVRKVSLHSLDVYWALDEDEPLWKDRVIGLSPLVLGLLTAAVALLTDSVPRGEVGIAVAASWAIYTLFGGLDDYRTAAQSA